MPTTDETTGRVSQQSANGLPKVYQRSTKPARAPLLPGETANLLIGQPVIEEPRSLTGRASILTPFGRLLAYSVVRIGREMLDHETRQRLRSERTPEPLLTLKEAADYLRLTPAALYTQRHRGHKPGALGIRVGRKILYRPSDINRYLDELLAENQISLHR